MRHTERTIQGEQLPGDKPLGDATGTVLFIAALYILSTHSIRTDEEGQSLTRTKNLVVLPIFAHLVQVTHHEEEIGNLH